MPQMACMSYVPYLINLFFTQKSSDRIKHFLHFSVKAISRVLKHCVSKIFAEAFSEGQMKRNTKQSRTNVFRQNKNI